MVCPTGRVLPQANWPYKKCGVKIAVGWVIPYFLKFANDFEEHGHHHVFQKFIDNSLFEVQKCNKGVKWLKLSFYWPTLQNWSTTIWTTPRGPSFFTTTWCRSCFAPSDYIHILNFTLLFWEYDAFCNFSLKQMF